MLGRKLCSVSEKKSSLENNKKKMKEKSPFSFFLMHSKEECNPADLSTFSEPKNPSIHVSEKHKFRNCHILSLSNCEKVGREVLGGSIRSPVGEKKIRHDRFANMI